MPPKKSVGENYNLSDLSVSTIAPVLASTAACAQKPAGTDQSARLAEGQALGVQVEVLQFDCKAKTPGAQLHLSPTPSQPVSEHQLNIAGPRHSPAHPDTNSVAVPSGTTAPEAPSTHVLSSSAPNTPLKEPDPSKIVSLKIIVSE